MTVSNDQIYNEIESKIDIILKTNLKRFFTSNTQQKNAECMDSNNNNVNSNENNPIVSKIENHSEPEKIILLFYESKKNDKFWSLQSETKEYWERWDIKLLIEDKHHPLTDMQIIEQNVKKLMIQVMEYCNLHFNHLPKLSSDDLSLLSFSYEIITDCGQQDFGYSEKIFGAIKKLVQNAPQTTNS